MDKVLIIEDDAAISDLIKLNLDLAGYDSRQAFDGNAALGALATFSPNLLLLDISLPDMEGFDLMSQFKAKELPVIFLTARGGLSDKVKGLKMGADDYIVKPFEAMELLARIEAVLRRYGNKSEVTQFEDLAIKTVYKYGYRLEDNT